MGGTAPLRDKGIDSILLFMRTDNNILYKREVDLKSIEGSCLLLGPRMTGKTSLLNRVEVDAHFDLLDPRLELRLRLHPDEFWEEVRSLKTGAKVVVDEVQRVPALLDYVQMGIDQKRIQFLLSGSSARKLKRGGANLLGGRALYLTLHPLTAKELGKDFDIEGILRYGSLPLIASLRARGQKRTAVQHLKSYVTTYIKEEIQAEALVRKLDAFQRFLDVAAQSNGQVIEFTNISRESSVHMNTVKEHYSILEDTLVGHFVWPHDRSERKKARPKFYFFDCGVARALQNRITEKPTSQERGVLFETWVANELLRIRDYRKYEHRINTWRKGRWEVDFLIESGRGPVVGIECKSGRQIENSPSLNAFRETFPQTPLIVCSLQDTRSRTMGNGVRVWPFAKVIKGYRDNNL